MPTSQDLRRRYTAASDEELTEAHAAGQDAYNEEAWQIICEELKLRGGAAAPINDPPPEVATPAQRPLSAAAQDGYAQILAVVGFTLLLYVVWAVSRFVETREIAVLNLVRLALAGFLGFKLLVDGRDWARWALVSLVGLEGITILIAMVPSIDSFSEAFVKIYGGVSIALLTMGAFLGLSRKVSAFIAEKS